MCFEITIAHRFNNEVETIGHISNREKGERSQLSHGDTKSFMTLISASEAELLYATIDALFQMK